MNFKMVLGEIFIDCTHSNVPHISLQIHQVSEEAHNKPRSLDCPLAGMDSPSVNLHNIKGTAGTKSKKRCTLHSSLYFSQIYLKEL